MFARSGFVFSSTMFAVETSPTLHPARVNGTQGPGRRGGEPAAGTFGEYGMFGNWSALYVLVQYANDDFAGHCRAVVVRLVRVRQSPWPCLSPYRPV